MKAWYFLYKIVFFLIFLRFLIIYRGLNKKNILTLIAHNSVKNCRITIQKSQFKKEILKGETLLYQDIFILIGKKVIAVFTNRCLKKTQLLSCQPYTYILCFDFDFFIVWNIIAIYIIIIIYYTNKWLQLCI